jgi:hypothetical protein
VKLSYMDGVEVQTVAHALDLHPFMLSRWREEVRDGVVKGRRRRVDLPPRSARELKQLQALNREQAVSPNPRAARVLLEHSESANSIAWRRGRIGSGLATSRTSRSPARGAIWRSSWIATRGGRFAQEADLHDRQGRPLNAGALARGKKDKTSWASSCSPPS